MFIFHKYRVQTNPKVGIRVIIIPIIPMLFFKKIIIISKII